MSQPQLSLDSLTLRGYLAELRPLLAGAFLQKFSQLSDWDYRLIFRQPHGQPAPQADPAPPEAAARESQRILMVRLLPGQPRLTLGAPDNLQAVPPKGFSMLVRKSAQGRPLFGLDQMGLERVIELRFPAVRLMIELLDRQPNLLLVRESDQLILGGHQLGRQGERFLRPGLIYSLPPRPELPSADVCPDEAWFVELEQATGPLVKELVSRLFGLPAAGAQELVRRAALVGERSAQGQDVRRLAEVWSGMFSDLDGGRASAGISPDGRLQSFPLTADRLFPSLLAAEASLSLHSAPEKLASSTLTRRSLEQRLAGSKKRLLRQQEHLRGDLALVDRAEELQQTADLLIHHKDSLPKGPALVELPTWDGSGTVSCELEAGLSARLMAQKLYKKASKYRRAAPILTGRLELLQREVERVDELIAALGHLRDPELLAEFAAKVEELLKATVRTGGKPERPTTKPSASASSGAAPSGPRRFSFQGFAILVGRNPRQNEQLLTRFAARGDLWLHARDYPGSHVLIKTAGRLADPEVVEAAATLAARYSQGARETKLTVVCAEAQHVRKAGGGPAGKVIYEDELSLVVDPQAAAPGLIAL